jgi:hypothetical protein
VKVDIQNIKQQERVLANICSEELLHETITKDIEMMRMQHAHELAMKDKEMAMKDKELESKRLELSLKDKELQILQVQLSLKACAPS